MSGNMGSKVPLYAKVGWVATWIIMIVLIFMLSRNLVGSIVFGPATGQKEITTFYDNGFSDALVGEKMAEIKFDEENPLLRKSYVKGFRDGRDRIWHEKGN